MVVIPFTGSATLPAAKERSDLKCRFVFVGNWQHFFEGQPTWSVTRWVFDRKNWCVVFLEILDPVALEWVCGTREEVSSVEFDLNENDARFLNDLDEWGLSQSEEMPEWACSHVVFHPRSELATRERQADDRLRNAIRLRLPEGFGVRTVTLRFDRYH